MTNRKKAHVVEIFSHEPVYVFYLVNTMAVDDRAVQGAMESAFMELAYFRFSSPRVNDFNAEKPVYGLPHKKVRSLSKSAEVLTLSSRYNATGLIKVWTDE